MIIQVVAKTIKPLFVRSIPQLLFISSAMLAAALLQTMMTSYELIIDGMLIQHLDRDVPESGLVGCCQYDRGRNPAFQRLFPAKRAKTPPVTGSKAWKPGFGTRCAQVVASRSGKIQEFPGELGAHDMRAFITGAGLTFSRTKKACFGRIAAYLQNPTQYVSLSFHIYPLFISCTI